MSQATHPRISFPTHVRPGRTIWLGALLAIAAGVAVVLVLALGNESSDNATPASAQAQPSLRSDGGPEETSVAAAVGSRAAPTPDEAGIAASIAATPPEAAAGPDESRTAAAVGASPSAPDESRSAGSTALDRPGPR